MGTLARRAALGVMEIGGVAVAELRNWNYPQDGSVLDVSTMGAGVTTEIPGRINRRIEGGLYLAGVTDPTQELIVIDDVLAVVLYPFGDATGQLTLTGNMKILTRGEAGDVDGAVELAFTASVVGELARGVVP